jgi:hypothetical protein
MDPAKATDEAAPAAEAGTPGPPAHTQGMLDLLLALGLGGLAALAGLTSDEYPDPGPATAALMGAAGLVLVVRRSRPVLSYVACLGLMSLVCVLFGTYQAGTSLLIGLVASYSALASGVSLGVFIPVLAGFALANSAGPMPGRLGGVLVIVLLLYVGEGTVKTHVARILFELGLRDRLQVVVFAHGNDLTH